MDAQFKTSLAGTGRQYVAGQAKPTSGVLHVQVQGPVGNRPYGLATNLKVPANLMSFVLNQYPSLHSLATGAKTYLPVQFSIEHGDYIKVQIPGVGGNREYGYTAILEDEALAEYLVKVTEKPVTQVKETVAVAAPWQDELDDDDGTEDGAEEAIAELEESLEGIQQLVKSAMDELAVIRSKVS